MDGRRDGRRRGRGVNSGLKTIEANLDRLLAGLSSHASIDNEWLAQQSSFYEAALEQANQEDKRMENELAFLAEVVTDPHLAARLAPYRRPRDYRAGRQS